MHAVIRRGGRAVSARLSVAELQRGRAVHPASAGPSVSSCGVFPARPS